MYKIIRLRLTLSVVHSVSELCCPETKCLQSAGGKKKSPPNPGAEPDTPFPSVSAHRRESRELSSLPGELNCHLFSSEQLSQNYTHAGLNVWEEICRGSYLNTEVRPQFLSRTHIIDVFPPQHHLSGTSHIPNHPLNGFGPIF